MRHLLVRPSFTWWDAALAAAGLTLLAHLIGLMSTNRPAWVPLDQPNCTTPDVEVPAGFTFCLDNFRKRLLTI